MCFCNLDDRAGSSCDVVALAAATRLNIRKLMLAYAAILLVD